MYYYLNIFTLTSVCLSFIAILILIFNNGVAKEDLFPFFGSVVFALGLFGLAMLSRDHAPNEIIQLSQQVKFSAFWERVADHGKDMVVANFTSAIVIGISALFAHLASVRQFAYSLADSNRIGFWYTTYRRMHPFKMRIVTTIITVFSGIAWAALNGKLPSINA